MLTTDYLFYALYIYYNSSRFWDQNGFQQVSVVVVLKTKKLSEGKLFKQAMSN